MQRREVKSTVVGKETNIEERRKKAVEGHERNTQGERSVDISWTQAGGAAGYSYSPKTNLPMWVFYFHQLCCI